MTRGILLALVVAAGVSVPPAAPAQQRDSYRLGGDALLRGLRGEPPAGPGDAEPARRLAARTAAAYVHGVADATEGAAWCVPGGVLGHELVDRVYGELAARPPEALRQNAAILVRDALARTFPCPSPG